MPVGARISVCDPLAIAGQPIALRIARLAERLLEPLPYDRMESREHRGSTARHIATTNADRCVLENAPQLLRAPLQNLPVVAAFGTLELHLLRLLEVVHEDRIHLRSNRRIERDAAAIRC